MARMMTSTVMPAVVSVSIVITNQLTMVTRKKGVIDPGLRLKSLFCRGMYARDAECQVLVAHIAKARVFD